MTNALTVDVEDYYHVEGFSRVVRREDWGAMPSRVVASTDRLLDMFDEHYVKATFFVLGEVAKQHPGLVLKIAQRGHEIACHGMSHRLIYTQSQREFREETIDSKKLLEDLTQTPVLGYRAATYSITERSLWALDILVETGFRYDSSIFPMRHDRYGVPGASRFASRIRTPLNNEIVEFPISVAKLGRITVPVAGGGYFRIFPYPITRWGLRQINREKHNFVFYAHPWEIDTDQPKIAGLPLTSQFRHYVNIKKFEARLNQLLGDFSFTTMYSVLKTAGLLR